MKERQIYMAGKISKNDWRIAYQDGIQYGYWNPMQFGDHWYTGPFFTSCDHGCYHGENQHGNGLQNNGCDTYESLSREEIVQLCLSSIHGSDTFFAWVDSEDCFGTIAEIGYASSVITIPNIWIAGPKCYSDMWFIYTIAGDTTFQFDNPHEALEYFLKKHSEKKINYYEYIQSEEWKAKATAAKKRAGWHCQICNSSSEILDAHHRTYERLGNELPEDITVLCRNCHELYESNKKLAKSKQNGNTLQPPPIFNINNPPPPPKFEDNKNDLL